MKLLLLLLSIVLASADETLVAERAAEGNDVSPQAATVLQAQPSGQESVGEKKLGKRSYGLLPVAYVGKLTYAPALPWYRLGGLSSYGLYDSWYPSWPLLYSGWHGGWYKGW